MLLSVALSVSTGKPRREVRRDPAYRAMAQLLPSVVRRNTFRGRARVALVDRGFNGGIPLDNAFIDNRMDDFHASLADVVVKSGVVGTRIVGPGKFIDQGERTIIER